MNTEKKQTHRKHQDRRKHPGKKGNTKQNMMEKGMDGIEKR